MNPSKIYFTKKSLIFKYTGDFITIKVRVKILT